MFKHFLPILGVLFFIASCGTQPEQNDNVPTDKGPQEVNVYSHRHYDIDQELFKQFEMETGIKVNVVKASADELLVRLEQEGESSPADLMLTSDAGRLVRAKELGLLQPMVSPELVERIPPALRDPALEWVGLTMRARVFAYAPDRVSEEELSTYADLANENWKDRIVVRSSSNIYNQSLLASIIAHEGPEEAKAWAEAVVGNMARTPQGNDRDQVKAVAAGEGDLAIVNTYYIGNLLTSDNPAEVEAGQAVKIFFPNQETTGTHINISGAGLCKYAPNKENAMLLLEFLTREDVQQKFADGNFEYPARKDVQPSELLASWGEFKPDTLNLAALGNNNQKAVEIFNEVGWK
jgi:iron(III) transport system substrate-binding protein